MMNHQEEYNMQHFQNLFDKVAFLLADHHWLINILKKREKGMSDAGT